MQSAKETTANVAASAKAGMEKAKATAQEKVEKMTTRDPLKREAAAEKKDERLTQAELNKREAQEHNAAGRKAGGAPGYTTGQSATTGRVTEGVVGSQQPGYTTTGQPHATEGVVGYTTAGQPVAGAMTDDRTTARDTGGAGVGHRARGTGGTYGERGY